MNEQTKTKKVRNGLIEILRVIAICMIMFSHFCNATPPLPDHWKVLDNGIFGVILFILISGFFNAKSNKFRTFNFFIKSVIYIFWGLLIYIICYYCHLNIPNPWEFLVSKFIGDNKYMTWWFLYVYLALTLFQPFINKFIEKQNKWISLGIIIVVFLLWQSFDIYDPGAAFKFFFLTLDRFLLMLCLYSLGAWFGTHIKDKLNKCSNLKLIPLTVAAIGLGTLYYFNVDIARVIASQGFGPISIDFFIDFVLIIFSFSLIFLLDNIPTIKNRYFIKVTSFVGQTALPIYLFHGITWIILDSFYPAAPIDFINSYYAAKISIYFASAIMFSIIMYLFVLCQEKLFWKIYYKRKNNQKIKKK